jgi:integrase
MPRLVHRLPKYARQKSSGLAYVKINGRRCYLGPHDSPESRAAYDRIIAELQADRTAAEQATPSSRPKPKPAPRPQYIPPATRPIPVSDVVIRFFEHAERYYVKDGKPTGEHTVIRCVLRPLLDLYGSECATAFGLVKLKRVREEMIRRGWTRHYINVSMGRIKRCFRRAASEELIPSSVVEGLRTVAGLQENRGGREKAPVGAVPDDVIEKTLANAWPGSLMPDMVRLQRASGMRPGELLRLTPDAIDRTTDPWTYRPRRHKSQHHGRGRVVFFGPKAQAILGPILALKVGGALLFRANLSSYRRAICRACDRAFPHPTLAEIPKKKLTDDQVAELKAWRKAHRWHPNMLRHGAATEVRREYGLEGAQAILGHARADITEIYAELSADKAREIARKLG